MSGRSAPFPGTLCGETASDPPCPAACRQPQQDGERQSPIASPTVQAATGGDVDAAVDGAVGNDDPFPLHAASAVEPVDVENAFTRSLEKRTEPLRCSCAPKEGSHAAASFQGGEEPSTALGPLD